MWWFCRPRLGPKNRKPPPRRTPEIEVVHGDDSLAVAFGESTGFNDGSLVTLSAAPKLLIAPVKAATPLPRAIGSLVDTGLCREA